MSLVYTIHTYKNGWIGFLTDSEDKKFSFIYIHVYLYDTMITPMKKSELESKHLYCYLCVSIQIVSFCRVPHFKQAFLMGMFGSQNL